MILHCDDGIRHVEAVLEEPTKSVFCLIGLTSLHLLTTVKSAANKTSVYDTLCACRMP